jgi:hypothetical protein
MFTPFAYQGTKAAPTGWTPASFTNVQYWFTADAGVTSSGGNVTTWTDQINSFALTAVNNPQLTTSATLNGENVIQFDGTSNYVYSAGTLASLASGDFTILSVYNLVGVGSNGTIMGVNHFVGASAGRSWIDTVGSNTRMYSQGFPTAGGTPTTIESGIVTGAHSMKIRYDSSAGDGFYAYDTLTETTWSSGGSTGTDWVSGGTIAMGASVTNTGGSVFLSRYVPVEVAEEVFVYDSPSGVEMTEWKNYVNNKYGTIIS